MYIDLIKRKRLICVDTTLKENTEYRYGNNKAVFSYEKEWDGWSDFIGKTIGCFEIYIAKALPCYNQVVEIVEKYLMNNYRKAYLDDEWDEKLVHEILFGYPKLQRMDPVIESQVDRPFFERQYETKLEGIPNSIIDLFYVDMCVLNLGLAFEQEEPHENEAKIFIKEDNYFAESIIKEIIDVLKKNTKRIN